MKRLKPHHSICYPIGLDPIRTIFIWIVFLLHLSFSDNLYSQEVVYGDMISPMKDRISFFRVCKSKSDRIVNMIYNSDNGVDTIIGNKVSGNVYRFFYDRSLFIDVHLKRKWNLFNPLYNTHLTSDTVILVPIGYVKLYIGDSIKLFSGYESAYVGPKYVKYKTQKYKSLYSFKFEDYKE